MCCQVRSWTVIQNGWTHVSMQCTFLQSDHVLSHGFVLVSSSCFQIKNPICHAVSSTFCWFLALITMDDCESMFGRLVMLQVWHPPMCTSCAADDANRTVCIHMYCKHYCISVAYCTAAWFRTRIGNHSAIFIILCLVWLGLQHRHLTVKLIMTPTPQSLIHKFHCFKKRKIMVREGHWQFSFILTWWPSLVFFCLKIEMELFPVNIPQFSWYVHNVVRTRVSLSVAGVALTLTILHLLGALKILSQEQKMHVQ